MVLGVKLWAFAHFDCQWGRLAAVALFRKIFWFGRWWCLHRSEGAIGRRVVV